MNVFKNIANGKLMCEVDGAMRTFAHEKDTPPYAYSMEDGVACVDNATCAYVGDIGRHFRMEGGKLVDALAEARALRKGGDPAPAKEHAPNDDQSAQSDTEANEGSGGDTSET